MREVAQGSGWSRRSAWLVVLLCTVLVAGCVGGTVRAAAPSATPGPVISPSPAPATPAWPSSSPSPSPSLPADPFVGKVVVTVTNDLVVRSQPRVAADSVIYRPYLPRGTELRVIGGPEKASGYAWYEVVPVSFVLDGHPVSGWVAAAGKDGEPWIALPGTTTGSGGVAVSKVARAKADPKAAQAAATSITAFGLDLYKRLLADEVLDPKKGAVISPTSIAFALGLALAGAKGDTAAEMATVLHASGWTALGPGLNSLDQALASRDATWKEYDEKTHALALELANAAFAQTGWPIETAYLDRIAAAFGAGLRLVDFISHRTAARKTINAWVSERTKKRIPQLLGPNDLTPLTRLALVNAMYLKAEWEDGYWDGPLFREDATKRAAFTRLDGSRVRVPMMSAFGGQIVPYARGNGWRATELRYKGGDGTKPLAMTLILPDHLAAFERDLTAAQIAKIVTALDGQRRYLQTDLAEGERAKAPPDAMVCTVYPYEVNLFLPRFGIDSRADLVDVLKALGMPVAFDVRAADFTGITKENLVVSKVIHQANIDVDEKGTEAAAATAVLGSTTGGCGPATPAKRITLRLDHPFLFFVRDIETGAVLFMGRVVDPSVR
jgi:serpin B